MKGYTCIEYLKWKRLYMHIISQMEKVIPSFQYEPLIFTPTP
jgi:hypothetical protein